MNDSLDNLKNALQKTPTVITESILDKLKEIGEELNKIIKEENILEKSNLTMNQLENMSDQEFERHINRIKLLKDRKEKLNKLKG